MKRLEKEYANNTQAPIAGYAYSNVTEEVRKAKKEIDQIMREIDNTEGGYKNSWFKSGGFSDGVDGVGDFLGDLGQTVYGTVGDVVTGIGKGVMRMGEGVVDLGTYAVGGVGKLFGADEFWEDAKEVAQYSATDEWTKPVTDHFDKYSVLGNKADAVSEGLGQIAAIIATGSLAGAAAGAAGASTAGIATASTAATTAMTGLSSMGTNMGVAYDAGASDWEAVAFGAGTGIIEAGTELLSGGLGKGVKALGISRGIGEFDDIFAKKLSSKIVGAFSNENVQKILGNTIEAGVKSFGEGFEELLAGAGSIAMKKMTYMKDEELKKLVEDENLLEQFVVGAVVSSIAQSPGYIKANKTRTDFITGLTSKQEQFVDMLAEQEIANREAGGEKLSRREKNKIYNDVIDTLTQSKHKSDKIVGEIKYLTDNDYDDYIKSGNQHTRHKKADIMNSGESAILRSKEETDAFIERSLNDSSFHSTRAFSKANNRMIRDMADKYNVDVDGYYLELNSSDILHTAKHENEQREHQIPLTEDDLKRLPEYMVNYDDVLKVKKQKDGSVKAWLGKKINGHSIVITIVSKGRQAMTLKTAYLLDTVKYDALFGTKKEDVSHREATASNIDAMPTTSENVPSTKSSSTPNISQDKPGVNNYSMQGSQNDTSLVERLEAQSQNNEAIAVEDVKKATGFGNSGAELVADYSNADGASFNQVVSEVKPSYFSGFNNPDLDIEKMNGAFDSEAQKEAYKAGQIDRKMQDLANKETAKNATVYDGVFTENEYTKNFTKSERKMISTVAKSFKMDVSVVDKIIANVVKGRIYEADAEHQDGKMRISSTAEKVIYQLVMHEGGHRMKQLAPTEFGVLTDALYERAVRRATNSGVSGNLIFDNVKAEHDNAGITMDTSGYLEEFAVRELETIFSSAREFNRWYAEISGNQQVRTNFEKFIDWIYEVIDDIKRTLKQAKMSKAERAEANAELDRIKNLLANAYKAAENAATERTKEQSADKNSSENLEIKINEGYNRNANHSLKAQRGRSIELETMENNRFERLRQFRGNLPKVWFAYTDKFFYVYSNQSYMDYTLLLKVGLTVRNKHAIDVFMEEIEDGINGSTEVFDYWVENFRRGKGRYTWDPIGTSSKKATGRVDGVDVRPSGSDNSTDFGRSGKHSESEVKNYSLKGTVGEVIFSSRYKAIIQSQSIRRLYDSAKKGDAESAYNLLSQLLGEDDINRIRSLGNDMHLLPVVGAEGTSTNVLPQIIAKHISEEIKQNIFEGIYKENLSNSREKTVWGRMKENYPSFALGEKENIKADDIAGKKFVLIDDNCTTGRTFVGLKNFIEENGGEVVGYYALTTGQDQSEKMITTDGTWNKLLNLGLDEVKDFAEKEGIKREISKHGLAERETQELIKQFRRKNADSRRGDEDVARSERSRGEIQRIHDTEKKDGIAGDSEEINFSLKENKTKYTDKEYQAFGWARENDILNEGQNADYRSKFAMLKSGQAKFPKSKKGEYIIPVSDIYDSDLEGIDNILVFAKGTVDKPVIASVIEIYEYDETALADIRRYIYGLERRGIPAKSGQIIRRYYATDFANEYKNRNIEDSRDNNDNGLGGRNSREASSAEGRDVNLSLKGSVSATELLDTIDDIRDGKKKAVDKLAHYVDSGAISTELYDELVEKYGTIPKGENPARDISVPRKTAEDKKVSQTVRTILEAKATPDEAIPNIEKMVEDGIFSYDVYTDKEAISNAEAYIKEYGWDESLDDWFNDMKKGIVSKQHTVMGWALYNNAANIAATTTSETERTSAIKTSLKILDAMIRHQRSAAQALQATRILKKLSPETQLYGVQKSVQALQREMISRYGNKAPNLKIDEELAEQFLKAKTQEEREITLKELYKDIGRQIPSWFIDKWNAFRYIAMLGNLRTHIRNIVGNAGFAPVVWAKDMTAAAIESAVNRVSGKKVVRGKALISGSKADRALLKAAWNDYESVSDLISNGGKYNDFAMENKYIEEGRRIFNNKFSEGIRRKNSELLDKEDMWFAQPHYAYALAQYCKANNITAEQIQRGKAIRPARVYAIKEAQKATYRDTNAFSQMVSEWGRGSKKEKNVIKKAFNTVVEGILPFRKTPANILVRGVEYSPIGLLKGLSYDLYQVSKGNMMATEAIDNISAGLTGTGLLALGMYLAAMGLVRGHGEDEEKEKDFKELTGHQSYALELPDGKSVTLDWLAPEALPFFAGVNIWEATKGSDEEVNLSAILKSISNISEPMLEMSCLQSLNDLFEGIGYAREKDTSRLVAALSSAVTSYLTQGIPTLFGQAERTGEEYRMTTYTEKNDFLTGDMQYTLGKASAKIPFVDYHQIPYIDAWGRKEASGTALKRGLNNFLNPAYTSTIETSKMEEELLRLYEETGDGGVFPSRADKYFVVDGERKDLTAEEYVRYATLKGEKSYELVSDLTKSNSYKKLSDEEKVKAVKEAYDYANQKAKQAVSNYKPEAWVKKADGFGSSVGDYISFKTSVSGAKEDNGGKISKQEAVNIILDTAQNDLEVWEMYLSMYDSDKDMYAYNNGIDGEDYMNFLILLDRYDKPTKTGKYGTYTQEEAENAIRQLSGLTRQEKAVLWQSVNTSWKASNNPWR